ncbi:MAG: hypothetical protein J6Y85_03150, partial [Alphaproteobacteria bacterium]|nr:hypothetical protein [Alphaproteobacteria bacterium]
TPFVDKQICANMKGLSSSAIKVTTSMPMDNNRGHYIYLPDGKITFGSSCTRAHGAAGSCSHYALCE